MTAWLILCSCNTYHPLYYIKLYFSVDGQIWSLERKLNTPPHHKGIRTNACLFKTYNLKHFCTQMPEMTTQMPWRSQYQLFFIRKTDELKIFEANIMSVERAKKSDQMQQCGETNCSRVKPLTTLRVLLCWASDQAIQYVILRVVKQPHTSW